jgi:hypothetical protein
VPDGGGEGEEPLQDACRDPWPGAAAVAFEAELGQVPSQNLSEGVVMSDSFRTRRRAARGRVVGTALALALAVSACAADDPIAPPATSIDATSTTMPAAETTTTPATGAAPDDAPPTTTAASTDESSDPETSNEAEETAGTLPGEPRWSEIIDRLDASEQSCIRDVLDEAGLDGAERESAMSRRFFSDDSRTAENAAMLACLAADTVVEIFLTSTVAAIEPELGAAVSDVESACLRDWLAGIDLASLVRSTGESANDAAAGVAFLGSLGACVPDGFIALLLAEAGVSFDELDEEERACAREQLAGGDWPGLDDSEEDAEAALTAISWLFLGLLDCLPDLSEARLEQPAGEFSIEGATPVALGEPVEGGLDSAGDTDVFVFEAVAGDLYEIRVSAGTMDDPTVTLYDADGLLLDYNDDSAGSLDPLLYWEAPSTDAFYLEVGGYGAGSYTLTIAVSDSAVSDSVDDHADSLAGATEVGTGSAVDGVLDYDGDVDFFVFDAVEDELYELSASPGTLADPTLTLYDADGLQLDYNDDYKDSLAPRLYRRAESTGPLYVEVRGYGAGSYTLTITR